MSLRRWGDRQSLAHWAASGDPSARLMLAWAFALGRDGSPKDFQQAQRQLTDALRKTRDGKVIQAVITLNQEAKPAQITRAAADLEEAAQAGMVEAAYWLGRAQLAQQGPVSNPALGMERLRDAATRGHAHAALVLGRTYAEGRSGQARNVVQARRYLEQARDAGIPEAMVLLAKL